MLPLSYDGGTVEAAAGDDEAAAKTPLLTLRVRARCALPGAYDGGFEVAWLLNSSTLGFGDDER
jgi:hypothetical protein